MAGCRWYSNYRGDWNEVTSRPKWKHFLSELGLFEPTKTGPARPEPSYNCGLIQVNNMYVLLSCTISIINCIQLRKVYAGQTSHKFLVIKILTLVLGMGTVRLQRYGAMHQSKTNNQDLEKCNMVYKQCCIRDKIFPRSHKLWQDIPPSKVLDPPTQQNKYKEIDALCI